MFAQNTQGRRDSGGPTGLQGVQPFKQRLVLLP